jgi:DNA-binding LytR/AlgR family response regulator
MGAGTRLAPDCIPEAATMSLPTAILADDERLMREQLRARLKTAWPELQLAGEAANGQEAVALIRAQQPDIAFLDIRMPGLTGLEVAKLVGDACHIVFVTAYDQHAIEAFERGAVDYLLKPVDPERLAATCERLKTRLDSEPEPLDQMLAQLTRRLAGGSSAKPSYLRWIQANVGSQLRMIPTADILFFRADDKYTRVQTASYEALIRKPIKDLVEELDPDEYWQIHRSTLVRVDAISHITRKLTGQQLVHVKGHPEALEVSRAYSYRFKQM